VARPQLDEIARRIREYPGVTRKRRLGALTAGLGGGRDARVKADFGEDCAVLELPGLEDRYLLLALDAVVPQILETDPEFAGYASVLVNVLDVAAKGGTAVAVVDFLASTGAPFEEAVARGMAEATAQLGVPVVGGHLHPDSREPALAAAVLGTVPKRHCVFSHTARARDAIYCAVDLDGRRSEGYPLAWSSLRGKPAAAVAARLGAVAEAARAGHMTACKDASNPGLVGTAGMLLEASGLGGSIDIDRIPRPGGVPVEDWVLLYQGCGFVLTGDAGAERALVETFGRSSLTLARVGSTHAQRTLSISSGGERAQVFDLERGGVTGIPPVGR
jgi:selenophosphate synthetase-related protein